MAEKGLPLPQGLGALESTIGPREVRSGQTLGSEIFLGPARLGVETLSHLTPRQRGDWGDTHGSSWSLNLLERRQNLVREKVLWAFACRMEVGGSGHGSWKKGIWSGVGLAKQSPLPMADVEMS